MRLKEGKIYDKSKIEPLFKIFLRLEKILQLREYALREVTMQVERKIESEVFRNAALRPENFWPASAQMMKMPK